MNKFKHEGKTVTPPYAVHVTAKQGYQTPSAWDIRNAGKPTDANLAKWVEMYHQSLEPGEANAHLGKGARLVKAEIRRNVAGGDVVAKWSERSSGESMSQAKKILKALAEAVKDEKYQDVVFMQGDDAIEPLEILDEKGVEAAVEYLAQWDAGEGEVVDWPVGTDDDYKEVGEYIITWNDRLGYIGMVRKLTPEFKKRYGV